MNILKCLTEFFIPSSSEPVGLCSFEHVKKKKADKIIKPAPKKELRLSELME